MAEYNSFTYDEIKSSDFGVYIGGEKTFDAPSLRGQSIEIPGRNGNVFISSDSYENVELVYPSFNFEPDLETFRSKLAKLRNALSSRASYKRLTDTLHPDEFRMAVFRDGFEVKPIKYNTAAEFDIVFDCKPQRFLKSGEIPVEYTPGQTPSDEQTKTGSIVTFEAEEGTIISDIKADINPVQDLHGYDKPWAGGNGKNKLNIADAEIGTAWNGSSNSARARLIIPLKTDTDYVLSMNGTMGVDGVYRTFSTVMPSPTAPFSVTFPYTFNSGSNTYLTLSFNKTAIAQSDVEALKLQLEEGSTATDFAPYSNVCPISGWDSVKVTRTGKNLLDASTAEIGTAWNGSPNSVRARLVIPIKPNTDYVLSMNGTMSLDGVHSALSTVIPSPTAPLPVAFPKTINSGDNTYLTLGFTKTAIASTDIEALKLQLELGSTATAYEPYQGDTYTIDLNGTRYGGTLDVTSGVLTVDRAMTTFVGTETWTVANSFTNRVQLATTPTVLPKAVSASEVADAISNMFEMYSGNYIYANEVEGISLDTSSQVRITINKSRLTSYNQEGLNEWLTNNNVQLCYELATPITVQLTPTEVKTLLGTNNIWADSGDITVKYGTSPYIIVNPTDFPSKPLLEVTGVGSFWLGDTQITITGTSGQIIYIDCETGECYKVTGGIISPANGLVTLNRLDFPKLASGINNIQLGAGISKVKITPRWWRL